MQSKNKLTYIVNFGEVSTSLVRGDETFSTNSLIARKYESSPGIVTHEIHETSGLNLIECAAGDHDIVNTTARENLHTDESQLNNYDKTTPLDDITNSDTFALLRTNPALTANIRLIVDSNDNLYLDAFSANNTLSKDKYHKIPVSHNSYYGRDIMSAFRDVISDELYGQPHGYMEIFTDPSSMREEHTDMYRCGVETNTNDMYKESFAAFAPIKLGTKIPDFFVVFKVDSVVPSSVSSENVPQYLIKNGKQIKTFDLRDSSNIGKYLREIQRNAKKIQSPVYLSKVKNTWEEYSGISVDKGVITSAREVYERFSPKTEIDMSYMLTDGFKRNRLVSADIINLQFMFDDPSAGQFSTNTYFGLYLNANVLNENIYGLKNEDGIVEFYTDANHKVDKLGLPGEENIDLANFITGFTTDFGEKFYRTTEENKLAVYDDMSERVGTNVIFCDASKIKQKSEHSSFLTLTIHDRLEAGEHLRIIRKIGQNFDITSSFDVYDVILSNSGSYMNNKYGLSDESLYYTTREIMKDVKENVEIRTHAIAVSVDKVNGEDISISTIIERIYRAFKKFDERPFDVERHGNTLTLFAKNYNRPDTVFSFERISSITGHDTDDEALTTLADDDADKVLYFGTYKCDPIIIDPENPDDSLYFGNTDEERSAILLTPFYFEILGKRLIYTARFIDISTSTLYEGSASIQEGVLSDELCFIMKDKTTGKNKVIEYVREGSFVIETYKKIRNDRGVYVIVPQPKIVNYIYSFNDPSKYMFKYPNEVTVLDKISLYEHKLVNYVVCGIYPLMDFDFTLMQSGEITSTALNAIYPYKKESWELKDLVDAYKSGISESVISTVSPTIPLWQMKGYGTEDISPKGSIIAKLKSNYTNISTADNPPVEDASISFDMSRTFNNKDVRSCILDGTIKTSNISKELGENFVKYNNVSIYRINQNTIGFVYCGVVHKIELSSTSVDEIMEVLPGTNIFLLTSPYTDSATNDCEIFIDTESNTTLLIVYGVESDYLKTHCLDGNFQQGERAIEFKKLPITITIDNLSMRKNGGILVNGLSTFIPATIGTATTTGKIILNADSFTIIGNFIVSGKNVAITNPEITMKQYVSGEDEYADHINMSLSYVLQNEGPIVAFDKVMTKHDKITVYSTVAVNKNNANIKSASVFIKSGDTEYTKVDDICEISITTTKALGDNGPKHIPGHMYPRFIPVFGYSDEEIFGNFPSSCVGKLEKIWDNDTIPVHKYGASYGPRFTYPSGYNLSANAFADKMFMPKGASTLTESGYNVGYLFKTFYNSIALQRKNSSGVPEITITKWPKAFKNKKKIYFDLSNAVINMILNDPNFNTIWTRLGITNVINRRNYIINTILPMVKFDGKCDIEVRYSPAATNIFTTSDISKKMYDRMEILTNPSTKIVKVNNMYYVELEPNSTKIGRYHVSCKIRL